MWSDLLHFFSYMILNKNTSSRTIKKPESVGEKRVAGWSETLFFGPIGTMKPSEGEQYSIYEL